MRVKPGILPSNSFLLGFTSSRISRSIACAAKTVICSDLSVSASPKCFFSAASFGASVQKLPKLEIPGDFLKWTSLGYCRTSRFATGFTPLQPKPLNSIVDFEKVKDRSPEEIASIWDDYHLGRGHIGASMKAKLYYLLEQRAESW